MERKEFRLNEVIFKDGIYQNWMYSISEGSVDIYSGYGTSGEKKLITLTKGQFFGEIGMIALMPRTATAVAAEENGIYRINLTDGSYEVVESNANDDTEIHVISDDCIYIVQGKMNILFQYRRHVYKFDCRTGNKEKLTVM